MSRVLDGIMVGGSVGAAGVLLHETVREIKAKCDLPVILFPSSVAGLCENADAVFFMSLLNSRFPAYIVENQALGAPLVLRYGLEPIPMAYIIVEPGGTVGFVGDARLIPRRKPELAAAYALSAKFMGMRMVYLEAGSGADSPVPCSMVSLVKRLLGDVLLIVGLAIIYYTCGKVQVRPVLIGKVAVLQMVTVVERTPGMYQESHVGPGKSWGPCRTRGPAREVSGHDL